MTSSENRLRTRGLAAFGVATLVAALTAAAAITPVPAGATAKPSGRTPTKAPAAPLIRAQAFGLHDPLQQSTVSNGAIRLWDTDTAWYDLQPDRGQWRFDHLDAMVAQAQATGVKPMLVLGATPAWAAEDPTAPSAQWLLPGTSSPPRSEGDWVTYVRTVAVRYRGRIDAYQVMNEGSLWQFWRGSPERLARLTVLASRVIKAADPKALVVSTPMIPRQKHWRAWSTRYLAALRARRWPVDVFAVHSYQPDTMSNPTGRVAGIRTMQGLLRTVGAPRRAMWDTEANYSAASYFAPKVVGPQSADWVARAYLDSLRLGVARTYWYAYDAPVGHLRITLVPASFAASGFAAVASWLVGSRFRGCTDERAPTKVTVTTCTLRRGLRTSYVVWASANRPTRLPVRTATACPQVTACVRPSTTTYVTMSPLLLR